MCDTALIAPSNVTYLEPLAAPDDLLSLMARRRSIRRLRQGPFTDAIVERLLDAIRLTPAAFNLPPWHVVIVHERRDAFWTLVEDDCRDKLEGDRLTRYLDRLDGFRSGVGAILVFENRAATPALEAAWNITEAQARSFVEQGLGMVQLAIWLALTADHLVSSLQHWDWLSEYRLSGFLGLPKDDYRLVAAMPIGYADEPPRVTDRADLRHVVSRDRFSVSGLKGTERDFST